MPAIRIRAVPDDLHRRLRAKAAAAGLSLSDYVLGVLRRDASTISVGELASRAAGRGPGAARTSEVVDIIRAGRDRV